MTLNALVASATMRLGSLVPSMGLIAGMAYLGLPPDAGVAAVVNAATVLNTQSPAFTRATSAWDPYNNIIVAPGVERLRYAKVGYEQIPMCLIEGAGTNALAAGASEHMELAALWTSTCTVTAGQTDPSGGTTACLLTSLGSGTLIDATFTATAATWTLSLYLKGSSTSTKCDFGLKQSGSFVAGTAKIVSGPGTIATTSNVGIVTGLSTSVWTLVSFTTTSNPSAASATFNVYPDSQTGTSGNSITAAFAMAQASAVTTSYISNRNLQANSNKFSNASWIKAGSLTVAQTGSALPTGELGWTITSTTTSDSISYHDTVLASQIMTFSWLAKSGTATEVAYYVFDVTHSATIVSQTNYTSQINASSYNRISVTFNVPAGCTSVGLYPIVGISAATEGTAFIGDVQLDYGSAVTAYWGVDATIGVRDADSLTSTYAIGTGNGTLLGLVIPNGWSGASNGGARAVDDGTTSNLMALRLNAGEPACSRTDSSTNEFANGPAGTPLVSGVLSTWASVWSSTALTCYYNAVAGGSPASTTPPYSASATQIIGNNPSGADSFYGWVAVLYWPTALTAEQLLLLFQNTYY